MRHTTNQIRTRHGFTLIELLVAVAVLAILMVLATPSVQKLIRDSRVTSQTNEVIALVNLARNEAIRRGIDANDTDEAILQLDTAGSGWNGNVRITGEVAAEGCASGVIRCSTNANVGMTTTSSELSFESRGYLQKAVWTPETICLKHTGTCQGDRQHVQIRIFPSGQIEKDNLTCDATCPSGG